MASLNSSPKFTSGERTAVIVIAITSCVSVLSIVFLLTRVGFATFRPLFQGMKGRKDSREGVFFQTQLGTYAACLLLANLLMCIAGIMGFHWVAQDGIVNGPFCTAQGTLIQIGTVAGAYFTTITAVHTFASLVLQKKHPLWLNLTIVAFGWGSAVTLGTALTVITTPQHGSFFGSVRLFCAISPGYTVEQFSAYYLPLILAALATSILYALIFLCLRGFITIGDGIKFSLMPESAYGWMGRLRNGQEEYRHFLGAIVRSMLWYPFAFVLLFMPITIAGLENISGSDVSDPLLAFAGVCASLIGLANVLIIYNILRVLRPAFTGPSTVGSGSESFFVPEERKPSPVEAPKAIQHGKAFPPPTSRVGSPTSQTHSVYRPVSSGDFLQKGNSDTVQLEQPWLRHQRSSSSVNSTTHLLLPSRSIGHSRNQSNSSMSMRSIGHSRNPSSSSVLTGMTLANPIMPSDELDKNLEEDDEVRQSASLDQSDSTIGRAVTTGMSQGLPPPPRPKRGSTLRDSLLNAAASHEPRPIPPPIPPPPEFVDVSLKSPDHTAPRTAQTPRTPYTAVSMYDDSNARYTIYSSHDDFEIQKVDSRQMIRPAISAVAQMPTITRRPSYSEDVVRESLTKSSPKNSISSKDSVASSTRKDSLHLALQNRSSTPEPGLSSIAWASLVTHAATSDGVSSESSLMTPTYEEMDLSPPRPLAEIPMLLRPGTPGTAPNETHFRFSSVTPNSSGFPSAGSGYTSASESGHLERNASFNPSLRHMRSYNTFEGTSYVVG